MSGLDAASAAPVMSVDGFAKQFAHWPTQINGTELNGTEEKAKAAAACLADMQQPPPHCVGAVASLRVLGA